jgi:hypothetical protein
VFLITRDPEAVSSSRPQGSTHRRQPPAAAVPAFGRPGEQHLPPQTLDSIQGVAAGALAAGMPSWERPAVAESIPAPPVYSHVARAPCHMLLTTTMHPVLLPMYLLPPVSVSFKHVQCFNCRMACCAAWLGEAPLHPMLPAPHTNQHPFLMQSIKHAVP